MIVLRNWLLRAAVVLFAGPVFVSAPLGAVPIVSIEAAASTHPAGSSFNVSVDISSVTDLFAFQFDIAFDPTILSASSSSEGPFLPAVDATFFIPGTIDNTLGMVTFIADSLISAIAGASGNGTLATLKFKALAPGISAIDLLNVVLLDSALADITTDSVSGTVEVTRAAVPAPSSLLLIVMGILGLVGSRKLHTRTV